MRLTDDRYAHQRHRLEVALRLIRHEARTSTIQQCTGLSEDRIRKLHRAYFCHSGASTTHRRRGKSPQQSHCLTHNLEARLHAMLLAGIFKTGGVLEAGRKSRRGDLSIAAAEKICDAYELFAKLRPRAQVGGFTFEHAWYLARALTAGNEITTARCPRCAGLALFDLLSVKLQLCPLCEIKRQAEAKMRREKNESAKDGVKPNVLARGSPAQKR